MTDATPSTPGRDAPRDDASQGGTRERGLASFDTSDLFPDLFAYGREFLDRVSARAKETAPKIREKGYDADQWVDDIKWFWENATNDAVRAAKYWRERFPVE